MLAPVVPSQPVERPVVALHNPAHAFLCSATLMDRASSSTNRPGVFPPDIGSDGAAPLRHQAPCGSTLEALLLSTDWVQMLPHGSRNRVIADCHDTTYGPREFVARKGEPSTSWIGVVDGLLKVSTVTASGRSVMFTAVPSGSWVGEGSVIKREPRRYDLMAIRATRVIHVPRPTFMWLLETSVDFSRYVIDHLNERTGQFIAMLEVSRITEPAGRVAGAICNLFNPVLYPRAGPLLNISQEELGELAGLSRSTTNAAITRLKKLHLVNTEYGGLLVLDLHRLRAYVYASGMDEPEQDGREAE